MSFEEISLADVLQQTAGTAMGAGVRFLYATNHQSRLSAVQSAVDHTCNLLQQNPQHYQGLEEDQITIRLTHSLLSAGIPARHEQNVGGNCDVVVDGKDSFLWLAEAKVHSNYAWLDKGFQQLCTRYSTGSPGQDHGDILIYCYVKDALAMLQKWRDELQSRNPGVATSKSPCGNPLVFCSIHKHQRTGLDYHVRHKAISLLWDPQDK